MLFSPRWRRDAICLGCGALAGVVVAVSAARSYSGSDRTVAPPRGIASAQAVASPTPAAIDEPDDAPRRHRQAKANDTAKALPAWQQAVAAYLAPDGDPVVGRRLILQLSSNDLRKLALALASHSNRHRYWDTLANVFIRWGEIDPLNALAQAQAFPPSALTDLVTTNAARGFAIGDPERAAAYFSAPPSADAHGDLLSHSFRQSILKIADQVNTQIGLVQDPVATAAYIDRLPADQVQPSQVSAVAEGWADQDLPAALAWANHFSNPQQHDGAMLAVIDSWSQTDPQAAANYVLSTPSGSARDSLVGALVQSWGDVSLPDAARWLLGQTSDVQAQGAATLVDQWSHSDPAGAAAWAAQLPAGDARDQAFARLASKWSDRDPAAAASWLGGLPAGDARDAAIAGYATAGNNDANPADMLQQVQTIANPAKRDDTLVSVLKDWLASNPQAAHQWINQSSLPAPVLGKLTGG